MKTVDIRYYEGSKIGFDFKGQMFINMKTGEAVIGLLGGICPNGISSKSILFKTSKGKTKSMLVRNFVKNYQLVID